jgi:hypothetical protein
VPSPKGISPGPAAAELLYKENLEAFAARAEKRLARLPSDFVAAQQFLEEERNFLVSSAHTSARAARGMFSRVAAASKQEVSNLLGLALPAEPVGDMRDLFASRQVALIQRAIADQIELIRAALGQEALLKARVGELRTLRGRFRLIASNEAHKLFEAEVERWAVAAGEPGGWYVTHRDERVRPTHRAHDGLFYLYSDRPAVMGEVNCRCRLVPGARR